MMLARLIAMVSMIRSAFLSEKTEESRLRYETSRKKIQLNLPGHNTILWANREFKPIFIGN